MVNPLSLNPLSSKCRSIRSSHGAATPPPPGLEEGEADLRMAFPDPAPDHAHAGQHHLHRMRDDVASAAAFETVDADGRHAAARPFVKADRKIKSLRRRPERLVVRMMNRLVVIRVRPNEAAAHA